MKLQMLLLAIKSDEFLQTTDYKSFNEFRKIKEKFLNKEAIDVTKFIKSDPEWYDTYVVAGTYWFDKKRYKIAKKQYQTTLTKNVTITNMK